MATHDYDFSDPFMRVTILGNGGERMPLWAAGSEFEKGAKALGYKGTSAAFVQDVTIELGMGDTAQCSLTLAPTPEDADHLMDSKIVESNVTRFEVVFGYAAAFGLASRKLDFVVMDVDCQLGEDLTFTLKGMDVPLARAVRDTTVRLFKQRRRMDILEEVLLSGKPAPALVLDTDAHTWGTPAFDLLREKVDREQAGKTNWLFAREIAAECGCYLETRATGVVYVKAQANIAATKPLHLFRRHATHGGLIGKLDTGGVFPMFSASSPSKQVFLRSVTEAAWMIGVNSSTGEPERAKVTPDGVKHLAPAGSTGQKAGIAPKAGPGAPKGTLEEPHAGGEHAYGSPSDPEDKGKAQSMQYAAAEDMGVQLTVESVLIPDLSPGVVVQVEGIAKNKFDGLYMVKKVTHTIGAQGASTRWEGFMPGLSVTPNTEVSKQGVSKAKVEVGSPGVVATPKAE